jgi:K+-transporting ATPase ATPase B chain
VAKDGKLLGVVRLKDIQGRHSRALRGAPAHGHPHRHDHWRQPDDRRCHRGRSRCRRFLAQATPEEKLRLIRDEQAKGKLVAMCGDGTNDAPALAQADVGVAMQAAREAGNMVDLDSNPTKLIEIVEIGKQLLMTRGALTTFSIANDVAKYFAIIPAMFLALPAATSAEHYELGDAAKRHFVGDHLQCADHRRPYSAGAEGRRLPTDRGRPTAAPQPADHGLGGIIIPFIGIKAIDLVVSALHLA